MGPNPTPCWAAVKGQKKLETKPISVDFPSLGISFIMFHLYVLIFFVGSLLIFGDCFPPQTQHINPFNSSHPSSSIIIHAIHPFFGLHPYRPVQCDSTARPWHLVMLQSLLFEQLPLHLSLITALLHLVRENTRGDRMENSENSRGCPTKTD